MSSATSGATDSRQTLPGTSSPPSSSSPTTPTTSRPQKVVVPRTERSQVFEEVAALPPFPTVADSVHTTNANPDVVPSSSIAIESSTARPPSSSPSRRSAMIINFMKHLLLGQLIALLMSFTGVFSTLFVNENTSVPILQSLCTYVAITTVFLPIHVFRRWTRYRDEKKRQRLPSFSSSRSGGVKKVEKENKKDEEAALPLLLSPPCCCSHHNNNSAVISSCNAFWSHRYLRRISHVPCWRYMCIALLDVEANFCVVLAYNYTNLTSVQLLDCFTIPIVIILSYLFLKRKPTFQQLIGAGIALLGMGLLIALDALNKTRTQPSPNPLLGDAFVLISCVFYASSNVACEVLLKTTTASTQQASIVSPTNVAETDKVVKNEPTSSSSTKTSSSPNNTTTSHHPLSPPIPGSPNESDSGGEHTSFMKAISTRSGEQPADEDRKEKKKKKKAQQQQDSNEVVTYEEATRTATVVDEEQQQQHNDTEEKENEEEKEEKEMEMERNKKRMQVDMLVEYLALMPLFAIVIASMQLALLRWDTFIAATHHWTDASSWYMLGFVLVMIAVYALMPTLFLAASATFANLSLLTSDVYSMVWNRVIFGIDPKWEFFAAFSVIVAGLVVYDTAETGFGRWVRRKCCVCC